MRQEPLSRPCASSKALSVSLTAQRRERGSLLRIHANWLEMHEANCQQRRVKTMCGDKFLNLRVSVTKRNPTNSHCKPLWAHQRHKNNFSILKITFALRVSSGSRVRVNTWFCARACAAPWDPSNSFWTAVAVEDSTHHDENLCLWPTV